MATPWRMPQRLQFMRDRSALEASALALSRLLERERALFFGRLEGALIEPASLLDLASDKDVSRAAGLQVDQVLCAVVGAEEVCDRLSAARFCLGLLRRPEIRARFPRALGVGCDSEFARWLQTADELRLSSQARGHLRALFAEPYASRARQVFLSDEEVRDVLPHGLTPCGQRSLFEWFMNFGRFKHGVEVEEIWWLFMEAAEDPSRELMLAYLFTPDWQALFPDGLTVLGRRAFANWFAKSYGALGTWADPEGWPEWDTPAAQLRIAYWAHERWRGAHPLALSNADDAAKFVQWLGADGLAADERAAAWCRSVSSPELIASMVMPGVNLIGHFCYPSGLRVSAESMVQALQSVGVETALRDVRTDARDDPFHVDFNGMELYDITVIHTQPEPFFSDAYRRADIFERNPRTYRIAYWYWEFDSVPESWVEYSRQVDEVWAATEFVARGLRARLSLPVRTLFPGVKLAPFAKRSRSHFGLDPRRFTFLFTFHMMSVMERKNPLGLIRAFRAAFATDEPVSLVLKTSFGDRHPAQLRELREAAAGSQITIIDQVYSPDEVLSLMDACDAYVSLHRSEGLGLTMAEAMLLGKPVIATNFSGNVDFMDADNSLLVKQHLVKVGQSIPPYSADLEWAEPCTEDAAACMRRLYEDQAWARELGERGRKSTEGRVSLEEAGRRMAARLSEIRRLRAVE